jgi:heme O synthase-like polyprenyltransferase
LSTAAQSLTLPSGPLAILRDYSELFKARVTTLIVMTAWCGAYLALAGTGASWLSPAVPNAMLGVGFVATGAAGLNEVMERRSMPGCAAPACGRS